MLPSRHTSSDLMTPVRVGRYWLFASGRTVPVVAGAADDGPVVIPEDLTLVESADELLALEAQIAARFDALFDSGSTDVAEMEALADALDRVRGEKATRDAQVAADQARMAELHARIHASNEEPDDGDDGDGGDGGDPAPAEGDDGDTAAPQSTEREPALVAASRPATARAPVSVSASSTARRAPARPAVPAAQPRITITAAADLPGVSGNSAIDVNQVARSMHDKARGLSNMSGRVPIATFHKPNLVTITEHMSDTAVTNAIEGLIADRLTQSTALVAAATRMRGRGAGITPDALVAAVDGWCTPSQNSYDIFALDGQSGLLDLPSVGIDRGGINVPDYIGISAADGALWAWTAGQENAKSLTITDLDIASGVGTVTFSAPHLAAVGDLMEINTNGPGANGPFVVASITSTTVLTLTMTGVPNGVNFVGTALRQKSCFTIPCPTWTDTRLDAYGFCLKHGNLVNRSFSELTSRYVTLVTNAHEHRMSAIRISKIRSATHSDAVTVTAAGTDAYGEVMSALDLQLEDYRSMYHIDDNFPMEVLAPMWLPEALRANLAMRSPGDSGRAVTDAQLAAEMAVRGARPQMLTDYQPLSNGTATVAWPATVELVIYPAGNFVDGTGGTIDLGVVRDSRLNATNDFTAAWTEEFDLLYRRGPKARRITVTLGVDGKTGGVGA